MQGDYKVVCPVCNNEDLRVQNEKSQIFNHYKMDKRYGDIML